MTRIIAFSTNKGGVLKSSMTTCVAAILAKNKNKKVLIIDTDNQGNVALTFGKNPDSFENTIADVLLGEVDVNDAIYNVYENIDIIPANGKMATLWFNVLQNLDHYGNPMTLLKNAMEKLTKSYDVLLIDTPPNLELTVANVLMYVEDVIVPFHPETYSLRSLFEITESVKNFKQSNSKLNIIGIVPTKTKLPGTPGTIVHNGTLQNAQDFCFKEKLTLTQTQIYESVQYANAVGLHRLPLPLTKVSKKHQKCVDVYENLVSELGI